MLPVVLPSFLKMLPLKIVFSRFNIFSKDEYKNKWKMRLIVKLLKLLLILSVTTFEVSCFGLNLPKSHMSYYLNLFPDAHHFNQQENTVGKFDGCWGYEDNCDYSNSFHPPICEGDHQGWVQSKEDQLATFYTQADFGYVAAHRRTLQVICEPAHKDDSALECSEYLQFCRGRRLLLNLTELSRLGTWRYRMDVLQPGDLKGYCNLHRSRIDNQLDRMSPLQSWAPEIRHFKTASHRLDRDKDCDTYIDRPTIIVKIDAAVNMYHHFCDFFNLYASLHVNASHPSAFSTDVQVIIWETFPYRSAFQDTWRAFTDHPIKNIDAYAGKTVCFRNLMLPLLPRMIFGLYYNTPLVYGCEKSGIFRAFSEHVLHRLQIKDPVMKSGLIRVTWLSRQTTHRNVVNENELIEAARREEGVTIQRVVFDNKVPFPQQLSIIRSTDILISMHGAGLTHILFLPDSSAVFELYNCEDENCYQDLARLRGIKYSTWSRPDKLTTHGVGKGIEGGFHAKFVDYSFDVAEFRRIFIEQVNYVQFKKNISPKKHHDEL